MEGLHYKAKVREQVPITRERHKKERVGQEPWHGTWGHSSWMEQEGFWGTLHPSVSQVNVSRAGWG